MIQFLPRSGELRPPPDSYFLSSVTKLKEELSCHGIYKWLCSSLHALLGKKKKDFTVKGNSKVDCSNKGRQLSKHGINVLRAKPLIYTGAKIYKLDAFPTEKITVKHKRKFTGQDHVLLFL